MRKGGMGSAVSHQGRSTKITSVRDGGSGIESIYLRMEEISGSQPTVKDHDHPRRREVRRKRAALLELRE